MQSTKSSISLDLIRTFFLFFGRREPAVADTSSGPTATSLRLPPRRVETPPVPIGIFPFLCGKAPFGRCGILTGPLGRGVTRGVANIPRGCTCGTLASPCPACRGTTTGRIVVPPPPGPPPLLTADVWMCRERGSRVLPDELERPDLLDLPVLPDFLLKQHERPLLFLVDLAPRQAHFSFRDPPISAPINYA